MKQFILAVMLLSAGGFVRGGEPFDVAVDSARPDDPLILHRENTAPTSSGSPLLVMLHGLGSSRGEWAQLIQRTTKRGTLAYDLRGHGRSRGTIAGLTVNFE